MEAGLVDKSIPFLDEKDRYIERLIVGIHLLSVATITYMELYERADAGEKVTLANPQDLFAVADDMNRLVLELRSKGYGLLLDRRMDA